MDFDEILTQVLSLLQREGRISYSALKLRFTLDDAHLEALKDELIEAKRCAMDEHGKVLVWTGAPAAAPSSESVLPPPEAERRQLTVMFCDLVDSTALAERLDPEDLREVMLAYQAACAEVIQRFDGHIAQYFGDGVLVYYGSPHAHEDDPQRAVRAGLGIVEAIRQLSLRQEQERGVHLACRIGIHTGPAVVGRGEERDSQLAWGETLNLAARLQAVAQPNTVAIMASTYRLIRGYFVCHDQGMHLLKGIAAPVHVYQVMQESEARSRFDVAMTVGLTPLVDREEELHRLWQYWEQSRAGQGQVVLLNGEAGVGKSRMVEALRTRLAYQPYTYMVFHCSPYHTHSAFYAVTDYLQRRLQWRHDEAATVQREKLERLLHACGLPVDESLPLFTALLSLPSDTDATPLHNPQQQRQKTQEALVTWLMQEARQQPVLAVWEDLHWADPSTLELLNLVKERTRATRLLTLLTCRPEFHLPADILTPLPLLTLGRLEWQWVEQMVMHLTHGKALPHEVLQQVLAKTDGIPLFVEELVKMVLESGLLREEAEHHVLTAPLPPLAIPATLQDSLMARLDRLGMAREVAQVGATLGREFSYELIQAVAPLEEQILQQGLAQLVDAELIYQSGVPPQSHYLFKHALIQEAAYQLLLRSRRRHLHQRVAEVLTSRFPETVVTQPELLAHHYTEADLHVQAIPYWQQAGQRAIERSANQEAISHLTKGLEVLATLPSTPQRVQQELALQLVLGSALYMTRGHTVAEVERAYKRAYALCRQGGDTAQRFSVITGLWRLYASQAQLQTAYEWARQCVDLAQHTHNPLFLQEAHLVLGSTLFFLGDLVPAHQHLEQGIALYSPQHSQALTYSLGTNSRVEGLARTAWTLWLLGYPDQALVRSQEALALAQELSHAYSLGLALCHAAVLHVWRLEAQAALAQSETLIALATEQGFVRWLAGAMCTRGWALAVLGQTDAGIAQLRQGLAMRGRSVGQTHNHAMLADVYGKTGQIDAGLHILDELLPGDTSTEQHYVAEVYRLQGELMLQQDQEATAVEARFRRALDTARQQQAKILELRAAMSLSRLWQRQGKRTEAHHLLSEISAWFTEGFATADLQAARTLLETLT
jgi:class 3 adenylate cyclase/tetratricopeptide (TPR) repeat protein